MSNPSEYTGPCVGIGVFAFREQDNRFVMAPRLVEYGEGTMCLPGGSMEAGETIMQTARRELREETGLELLQNARILGAISESNSRWITVYVGGHVINESALQRKEPTKHGEWDWFSLHDLPKNTWSTITEFLASPQGQAMREHWLKRIVWTFGCRPEPHPILGWRMYEDPTL